MTKKKQAKVLREARDELELTNAELADLLGVSQYTLLNWMLPEESAGRRAMPKTAELLLERILSDHRGKKKA